MIAAVVLTLLVGSCGTQAHQAPKSTTAEGSPQSRHSAQDSGPGNTSGPVVIWMPLPPVPPTPYGPPLDDAPACAGADMRVSVGGHNGATGRQFTFIDLTNTSSAACAISGYPVINASGDGIIPTSASPTQLFDETPVQDALNPGETAGFTIVSTDEDSTCDGDPKSDVDYSHLALSLPGGGTAQLENALPTACPGLSETALTHIFTNPEPLIPLKVTLRLQPAVAPSATTLRYQVTLTNPTAGPISLQPCPNYQESQSADPIRRYTYHLNCGNLQRISGGGSDTFAMQIPLAQARTAAGSIRNDVTIDWQLEPADGDSLGAAGYGGAATERGARPNAPVASDNSRGGR